jgi:glutaredoxin-related protein
MIGICSWVSGAQHVLTATAAAELQRIYDEHDIVPIHRAKHHIHSTNRYYKISNAQHLCEPRNEYICGMPCILCDTKKRVYLLTSASHEEQGSKYILVIRPRTTAKMGDQDIVPFLVFQSTCTMLWNP